MTHRHSRLTVSLIPAGFRTCVLVLTCLFAAWPATASAQSAAGLYATVYGQETTVRTATPPASVTALRAVVSSYERVVRKFPSSAYSDNALWQGAGLAALAYETFGETRDMETAERLLLWLQKEYPSSSLVKQVPARIAALHTSPPTPSPSVLPVVMNKTPIPAASPTPPPAPAASRAVPSGPPATIRSITHTTLPRGDRITIELSNEVSYAGDRIVSPDRIYFDFRNASAPSTIAQQVASLSAALSGTLIKSLRVGQPASSTARLTMELADAPRYSVFPMYQPFRLVIDVERVTPAPPITPVTTPPVRPASRAGNSFVPAAFPAPHTTKSTPAATPVATDSTPAMTTSAVISSSAPTTVTLPVPTPEITPTPSPTPTVTASAPIDPPVTGPIYTPTPIVVTIPAPPKALGPVRPTTPPPPPPSSTIIKGSGVIEKVATPPSVWPTTTAAPTPTAAPLPTPTPTTIPVAPSTTHGDYSIARQLGLGISRIVIDPGHGGHDPGAQGNGISEAELVLDVSLRLEALLLEQPGFDVVLTRRTDEFVALEERTAMANRQGADLFLSIHANASRQSSTRGLETYFLNFATNPAAEAVAARENATSSKSMNDLPDILKTVALNNKLAESRAMAEQVQQSLLTRLQQKSKGVADLGVKQALFVVLIGAQMPSVLSEISFVTNRSDAVLLKQPSYRQGIAQALCDAIVKYRDTLKKVTPVAAKAGRK